MDKELLSVMACPTCKSDIRQEGSFILCEKCRIAFPILDGVPDMLLEDSWSLEKAEKTGFKHKLRL